MAVESRDIDALVEDILHGAEERLVAELTAALVESMAAGILGEFDRVALATLARANRAKIDQTIAVNRGRIATDTYDAALACLADGDLRDVAALESIYGAAALTRAAGAARAAGASEHMAELAHQTARGLTEIIDRQNLAMADATERAWYRIAGEAITARNEGLKPLDKIMADAVSQLARAGIEVIDYKSGITSQIDVAIRRHVVSQVSQAGGHMTLARLAASGHELVITSAHYGARPSHAAWQGRPCCASGPKEVGGVRYPGLAELTGYGTVGGLKGVNCRHSIGPYFPGVTQLPDLDFPRESEHFGMTSERHYEATQRQRELERRVRATKREIAAMEQAGLGLGSPAYVQKRLVLGRQQAALRDHCAKNGLVRQHARERAYGVGSQPRALRSPAWRARVSAAEAHVPKAGGAANAYTVAYKAVNSKAYHDRFERLPFPKPVRESAYREAGRILRDRNGTGGERMVVVNARTGDVVADTFGYDVEHGQVNLLPADAKRAAECADGAIVLHNHPGSGYPSAADILSAARNASVKGSIVACHDGTVYLIEANGPDVVAEYWKLYNEAKERCGDKRVAASVAIGELEKLNEGAKWYRISRL